MIWQEVFQEWTSYLIFIPACVLCYLPMRHQLRKSVRFIVSSFLLFFVAVVLPAEYLQVRFDWNPDIFYFGLLLAAVLYYIWSVKAPVCKALAVIMNVIALLAILSNFAAVYDAWFHPNLGFTNSSMDFILFQNVAGFAALLLLAYPWGKYGARVVDTIHVERAWFMAIPFSAVLLAFNLVIRPLRYSTLHFNRVGQMFRLLLFLMLAAWVIADQMFYVISIEITRSGEIRERNRVFEMQEKQYHDQMRYLEDNARERHDFRQTILALKGMAESGNLEDLNAYLDRYVRTFPRKNTVLYCRDSALNAILNYYANEAREAGIRLNWKIDPDVLAPAGSGSTGERTHRTAQEAGAGDGTAEHPGLLNVDLSRVIGNLLDNALTAAREGPENRFIQLTVRVRGRILYIVMTNSFDGRVRMENGKYESTKGYGRGVGLSSVRYIVERYGGRASFSHEGMEFYSNVLIPLPRNLPAGSPGGQGGN